MVDTNAIFVSAGYFYLPKLGQLLSLHLPSAGFAAVVAFLHLVMFLGRIIFNFEEDVADLVRCDESSWER